MTKTTHPLLKVLMYLLLIAGAVFMVFPFIWMLSTSLKTVGAISQMPPQLIPNPLNWDNYVTIWNKVDFGRYTLNSFFIVSIEMVGSLVSSAFVAFGLAMFTFRLRGLIYMIMLATLMIPSQVTMIPTYFIWKEFGALNSYYPLIVPSFLGGAFGIFLMHQFIKSLPKELYESATIDGCSPPGIFFKIYLPLCKPALAALGVFTFMGAWNNTLGPLIYLQDKELYTLPLGLLYLKSENVNQALLMAGAVITTLPVVIVYLFAQKQFVQGIASTGMKG
ncbi:carbohydrate ABC transporter permease [Virgibacillus sp. LDC1]|jgi:multiple sugar transport system permease protein|uniref:carbohydrate ABC transporter permease n=1 Tax=Bacillales TaxID=1385 RepID=UPI0001788B8F|nr:MULTISPECIES: carbohydrate ABC transporter permease [Paenibacillus]MBY0164377.1 carbohydrate ABC transporter permease [Cytobacillus firmus]MCV4234033.1 carbohydrate ABC transporter permease [Virgibacillus sp. LDC1]VTR57720.1 maltose transporter permease [Actinobacillus pleuropneumoniae]ACX62863.1 binding-protein-dependent transport systems inner membrane component [Paenibacillus sp. Y412MC10]EGG36196.1 ABC transporter, permease protein [Paenibacillus sp. HGF5]